MLFMQSSLRRQNRMLLALQSSSLCHRLSPCHREPPSCYRRVPSCYPIMQLCYPHTDQSVHFLAFPYSCTAELCMFKGCSLTFFWLELYINGTTQNVFCSIWLILVNCISLNYFFNSEGNMIFF